MSQKFERGALVVLILMVLLAGVMVAQTLRYEKKLFNLISITDGRTEHLLNEMNSLKEKVEKLERR